MPKYFFRGIRMNNPWNIFIQVVARVNKPSSNNNNNPCVMPQSINVILIPFTNLNSVVGLAALLRSILGLVVDTSSGTPTLSILVWMSLLPIIYFDILLNYHDDNFFAFRLLQYLQALFLPIRRWTIIWCCCSQRGWKFRSEHMWPPELGPWEESVLPWSSQQQAMGVDDLIETSKWRIRRS